ncbi:MAG: DUF4286 family protein [Pseudomonadota bacterium]
MSDPSVIYEVNLTIAPERALEFDKFLQSHVDEMVALPGFISGDIATPDVPDTPALPTSVKRTVQYRLENRAAYERYLTEHADRMRADGLRRFGDALSTSRRVLTITPDKPIAPAANCSNCGAAMRGQYCSACGQRHRNRMISVFELLKAAFDDVLNWDARVWRTLRPLLFSPGTLTVEYLAGRRAHYTPPLRMYLVLSIAFFLMSSLPSLEQFQAANMVGLNQSEDSFNLTLSGDNRAANTTAAERRREDLAEPEADSESDENSDTLSDCTFDAPEVNVPGLSPETVHRWLIRSCQQLTTDEGRLRFVESLSDLTPKLLIVLLPIIALVGKLIYPFSRRYYVEHLLFYTHTHSFLFLLLILLGLTYAVGPHMPFLSISIGWAIAAATLYAVYYLYRSLRRVFRQGRIATVFKMSLIYCAYLISSVTLLLIGSALATLSL